MRIRRIIAVLKQEIYLTLRSHETILDIFLMPLMSFVVFGYLAKYISGSTATSISKEILAGVIFWQVFYIVQYCISVQTLWNLWARNLSNMFISPLKITEYVGAHLLSGVIKALIIFFLTGFLAIYFFEFSVFELGFVNISLIMVNLMMFSFAIGLGLLGLLFKLGTRIQAFGWGLLPMLQPLMAVFYPVDVLPNFLVPIARVFPATYVFEGMRTYMRTGTTDWSAFQTAFAMNIIFVVLAIFTFKYLFRKSRETGQFARNES